MFSTRKRKHKVRVMATLNFVKKAKEARWKMLSSFDQENIAVI